MTLKLIAVDMDETFLREDKTYDVERFKRIYKRLNEKGILFLVASGNSYHQLTHFFDEEDKEKMYFAGDNGSFIVQKEEKLHSIGIERRDYLAIVSYLNQFSGVSVYVSVGDKSYMLKDDPFYDIAKVYNGVLKEVASFSDIPESYLAYKIALITEHPLHYNKELVEKINQKFSFIKSVTSGNIFIDILHKDSGKGFAIGYLKQKYDLSSDEIMAFGDSMNDLTMMQEVTYSIAMGNSDPELAKACTYQIGTNNEQAVLETIEKYLEDDNLDFLSNYIR